MWISEVSRTHHVTALWHCDRQETRLCPGPCIRAHNALQIGAVLASVADYLLRPDRTRIWIQNSLNKNGSNVADLYAALHQHMRTRVAGPHSTSPDHELHIYDVSVFSSK